MVPLPVIVNRPDCSDADSHRDYFHITEIVVDKSIERTSPPPKSRLNVSAPVKLVLVFLYEKIR